ncbi:TetR/AcrR family transcriptional regulator [Agrobacterium pusense]|uniref:TetR/AcrR family transcriptional regulator n=1 Tax=Agrobacterium pusense TaxID=648995 RepID=UPI003D125D88
MKVTRDEILAAARELFREKGYTGASMQDLADRIGLKKASLYMRFSNKEALVPEVLNALLRETLDYTRADSVGAPWQQSYETALRAIAGNLAERKRCVGLHLAYGVSDETPAAKDAVRRFFHTLREHLISILSSVMSPDRAELVASDALARIEGATLLVAVFGDKEAIERAVQDCRLDADAAVQKH